MTNTVVIQERTDEKGWVHRIEIPLMTFLTEHDLEPVVRCKDCKYYYEQPRGFSPICELTKTRTEKDGFCSWGKKKDE